MPGQRELERRRRVKVKETSYNAEIEALTARYIDLAARVAVLESSSIAGTEEASGMLVSAIQRPKPLPFASYIQGNLGSARSGGGVTVPPASRVYR